MTTSTLLNPYRFATSTFNPLTQVTALHAMWAGDSLWSNPGDGNAVASMRNQSGGGDPAATGGAQPLYRASVSQLGNKPAVEFDGTDDVLDVNVTDTAQAFKIVCAFRLLATTTGRNVLGIGSAASSGFGTPATAVWTMHAGTALSGGTADTTGHVLRATFDTTSQFWLNGSSVTSGSSGSGAYSRVKLGAGGTTTGSRFCNCQIAFLGVYTGATSDAVLSTLATDLKSHYGL